MLNIDDRLTDLLNESELFLCVKLMRYMRHGSMVAWPTVETLCKACGWNEKTLKKHRASLIEKGILKVTDQHKKPSIYEIIHPGFGLFTPPNFTPPKSGREPNFTPPNFSDLPPQNLAPEVINKEVINNTRTHNSAKPTEANGLPKKIETVDEAKSEIFSWKNSAGAATIFSWYQTAKIQYSDDHFQAELTKFLGCYLTGSDEGKKQRLERDPVLFFRNGFARWLEDSKRFNREQKPTYQNHANRTSNPAGPKEPSLDRAMERAARVVASMRQNR